MERNHRMELQYDGTGLHGWAKQEGLPTVEGSLESAFRKVLGHVPALRVAGRTDAGVHARRQVASFTLPHGTDLGRLVRSLNALTEPGIAVTRITVAPPRFDARKNATSRVYRYYMTTSPVVSPFWRRYCWQVPGGVDLSALWAAAEATVGRHDFTAFTPAETEHVFFDRLVMRCACKTSRGAAGGAGADRMMYLEIEAEAFLRHMVRSLVGTMVEVAQQRRTLEEFERLLGGAPREEAGATAPAHGLFLWNVRYGRHLVRDGRP
ncbi:MAG: tRNA pseudouridine(38-40) synthase TruA [Thermoleophilia bacterium]|nr:tRNA pseudouridine(38-40) synthase TruA [Thermoleophilia bacterium]